MNNFRDFWKKNEIIIIAALAVFCILVELFVVSDFPHTLEEIINPGAVSPTPCVTPHPLSEVSLPVAFQAFSQEIVPQNLPLKGPHPHRHLCGGSHP